MTSDRLPPWTRRCSVCLVRHEHCVCAQVEPIDLPFRLTIVRHRGEVPSQSNTGGVLAKLLRPVDLLEHGWPGVRVDLAPLTEADTRYALLWPSPGAEPITPALLEDDTPLRVVILDATWRKARRMTRRIEPLRTLPTFALDHIPYELPRLRKPPREAQFSTAESVVATVDALGLREEARQLADTARLILNRRRQERGKISRATMELENAAGLQRIELDEDT